MSRRAMMGAVGVAALLVGCSESSDVATGPRYGTSAPTTSSCNITQTRADARAYLPNSVQTTVQALIKTLGDQYTAGNTVGATNTGFDVMTYVANAHRDGSAVGTPLYGSNLTNDLIGCMAVGALPPMPIDFTGALGLQGGYEVRGGTSNAGLSDAITPVFALGKKSALQAPAATLTSWNTWLAGRALFYGAPISNTPTFLTETPVSSRGYNWSTIPVRHTLVGDGLIGICVALTDRDRIQTSHTEGTGLVKAILTVQNVQALKDAQALDCSTQLAGAPPTGLLPRLATLAFNFIRPAPAYAALSGGGTGGTLNGLSDIGVLDAVQVKLTMSFINDATTTTPLDAFTVTANGNNGTPLPKVTIHLLVSGNSGSFTPISPTAVTDSNGVATFTGVLLDKAGGYTLEATSDFTGYAQSAVFSNLFHIKQ